MKVGDLVRPDWDKDGTMVGIIVEGPKNVSPVGEPEELVVMVKWTGWDHLPPEAYACCYLKVVADAKG